MDEHLTFVLFLLVPVLAGVAIFYFARHLRQRAIKAGWRQLVVGNLLVLTFLVSILFVAGETYYRFAYDTTDSLVYTKVSQRWFSRYWQDNSTGCRDNIEYSVRLRPDRRRVTFIGDSFTAGHGIKNVENRFANLIRRNHPEWDTQVLAMPGLDTGNELQFLGSCLTNGYQLQNVVLVYCLNDVSDLFPDWLDAVNRIHADVDQSGWLRRNSYLVNTLYSRYKVSQDPYTKNYFHFVLDAYRGSLWEQQKQRLQSFRDLVQTNGGQLSVVTFPFLHALGPDYEYQFVHDELDQFWKTSNVPHLDLLPLFKDRSPSKVTVNSFDAHPNEYAHALAAEVIEKFLAAQMSTNQPPQLPAN